MRLHIRDAADETSFLQGTTRNFLRERADQAYRAFLSLARARPRFFFPSESFFTGRGELVYSSSERVHNVLRTRVACVADRKVVKIAACAARAFERAASCSEFSRVYPSTGESAAIRGRARAL